MRPRRGEVLASLSGAAWFLSFGARWVNPSSLEPVMVGDWATGVLGWLMFRHAPLSLPLGALPNLLHPGGTAIAFTDSAPLWCVLLRPIQALLPADFQFIGLLLLASFSFAGWAGARLVAAVSDDWTHQALGGFFFALAPALLRRIEHQALCAQGLLVLMIAFAVAPCESERSGRRRAAAIVGCTALSGALHPYLLVMVLASGAAVCVGLWWQARRLPTPWLVAALGAQLVAAALTLWAFGFLAGGIERITGDAYFSADLATLINPGGYSRFFGALPTGPGGAEGFAYLGVGGIVLVLLAAAALASRRALVRSLPFRRGLPLVIVAVVLFALALGPRLTVFGTPFADFSGVWAALASVLGPFRSIGRFAWPSMYLLLAFAALGLVWAWKQTPRRATVALGVCVVLQLAELSPQAAVPEGASQLSRLADPRWSLAEGQYEHVALVPAEVWRACGDASSYHPELVVSLTYLAYRHGWTFNSGYVARYSMNQSASCAREDAAALAGEWRPRSIYVVDPAHAATLRANGARCGSLDGLDVCVAPADINAFAASLEGKPL